MNLEKLIWIKVVTLKNKKKDWPDGWAYLPSKLSSSSFSLDFKKDEDKEKYVKEPKKGDLMLLAQHNKITHVVEILDNQISQEDSQFHHNVKVIWWESDMDWNHLPLWKKVLGFDPKIQKGIPYRLESLAGFEKKWKSQEGGLSDFQKHVAAQLTDRGSERSNLEGTRATRLEKVEQLRRLGASPYGYRWDCTHHAAELQKQYADLPRGEEVDLEVAVAGRILARRVFGKLAFFTLQDATGMVQLYLERQTIQAAMGEQDPEAFSHLKQLTDAGDIIGVKGTLKRTDKGELSVKVSDYAILTKALLPLPDKWHGLTDVAKRYRQRYVDLIMNSKVQETLRRRAQIITTLRRHLENQGFIEIETPVLQPEAGGADARPFITHHNTLDLDLYLRIATELHLKRLLVGGFEKVFELGRIFRNEGTSTKHNPEFTSVEVYQAYGDYTDMMTLTEALITTAAQEVLGTLEITYQDQTIHLTPPWQRVTLHDIVKEVTGLDFDQLPTLAAAQDAAAGIGIGGLETCDSPGKILNRVFEEKVEATLVQPTFILDYPVEVSPLAKPHRTKPGLVERFELFIAGRETANSFSELTDPIDQRQRLEAQAARKAAGDLEAQGVDEDFLTALEYGMPPAGGLGIGIDRLVMVLTNCASIRDVIAFPLLKPEPSDSSAAPIDH